MITLHEHTFLDRKGCEELEELIRASDTGVDPYSELPKYKLEKGKDFFDSASDNNVSNSISFIKSWPNAVPFKFDTWEEGRFLKKYWDKHIDKQKGSSCEFKNTTALSAWEGRAEVHKGEWPVYLLPLNRSFIQICPEAMGRSNHSNTAIYAGIIIRRYGEGGLFTWHNTDNNFLPLVYKLVEVVENNDGSISFKYNLYNKPCQTTT